MKEIKIIQNFLNEEECQFYIDYINKNIQKITFHESIKRYHLAFGKEKAWSSVHENLDIVSEIKKELALLFLKIERAVKKITDSKKDLFVSSLYITKQISGASVGLHSDTNNDIDPHIKYSTLLYLNTMKQPDSGILNFPNIGYSYSPKMGDLLIFPSAGEDYLHEVLPIKEDRYNLPIFLTDDPDFKLI
jgi:hypothetical protein